MKEHYSRGQLTEPVYRIRKTSASDGAGGFTETEATTGPHFAHMRQLRGDERLSNEAITAGVDLLFVFDSGVDLVATDVLSYNGVRYNITALPPFGRSTFREVMASSGDVT